jgi:hypothetical protein
MMAGYSETPLLRKLGIKEGQTLYLHHAPEEYFAWLGQLPGDIEVKQKLSGSFDFIHLFVTDQKDFQQCFVKAKMHLKTNGMIWVSWPKKSAKVSTDVDEHVIRNFGLKEGLVDVKVCAVSEIWSGLKFVIRLKDR